MKLLFNLWSSKTSRKKREPHLSVKMLSVNTSTSDRKSEGWSLGETRPIIGQGQTAPTANQQSLELSQTEPWFLANDQARTQEQVQQANQNNFIHHPQSLSTLVDCRAQLLSLVTENGYFQTGATRTTVDHIYNVHNLPYQRTSNPNVALLRCPTDLSNQIDVQPQATNGSSLVSIPVIPPSPYGNSEARIVYPSAASDTNSTCGTRRHFRRRVANYHQNQRHHSQHHSQSRPVNLLARVAKMRPVPDAQNGAVVWKNGSSRNTASLSPPARCGISSADLASSDNGTTNEIVERRATSVGPPASSSNQNDMKSGGSSDLLQSPSCGESLDVMSVDCMMNAWAHADSVQPNRTFSNPIMHTSQTAIASTSQNSADFSQPSTAKSGAIRSRSHHQLMTCDADESEEQTDSRVPRLLTNTGFCIGPNQTIPGNDPACSNMFCPSCEWQSPGINERAFSVLDRWYQRYYTISRNPENYAAKMLRSPISVLAPCKGKLHLKIESNSGVIQLLIIEAKGLRSCTDAPCNSFVKVTVVPDKLNTFTQSTPIVESKANPVYNHTITLDLNKSKHSRRIMLTVYCQQTLNGDNELIGGMSFGVSGIHTKKEISGWYYLLNETMARKKHLRAGAEAHLGSTEVSNPVTREYVPLTTQANNSPPGQPINQENIQPVAPYVSTGTNSHVNTIDHAVHAHSTQNPTISANGTRLTSPLMTSPHTPRFSLTPIHFQNPTFNSPVSPGSSQVSITVPKTNQALNNMHLFRFLLSRGPKGFGFTLSGGCPVYVSHVEPNSPAIQAGVQPGDFIVAVNNINVSRSTTDSVVRIFRMAQSPIYLTVCRPTTVCVKTQSSPRTYGTKTFSNLFHRGCLSHLKKSASNDSMRLDCAVGFPQPGPGTQLLSPQSSTPTYAATTFIPCIGPTPVAQSCGPPAYPGFTTLPNSRSLYHLSPNRQSPRPGTPAFPNSKTEMRLCDVANGVTNSHLQPPPIQIPTTPTNIPIAKPRMIGLPAPCSMPVHNRPDGCWISNEVDSVAAARQVPPSPLTLTSPRPTNICSPIPSPTSQAAPPLSIQPRLPLSGPATDQPIVDCLKYVSHIKQVDFRQHSPRLEHFGCLNLLESNCCSKVELLMFPDLLLIAQRAPNHFYTVIKDPIYNAKICYVNIPPNASDQLILQYIDDHNRKQVVHFQGSNVREWLTWIQGHMIYDGNWWMGNVQCSINF